MWESDSYEYCHNGRHRVVICFEYQFEERYLVSILVPTNTFWASCGFKSLYARHIFHVSYLFFFFFWNLSEFRQSWGGCLTRQYWCWQAGGPQGEGRVPSANDKEGQGQAEKYRRESKHTSPLIWIFSPLFFWIPLFLCVLYLWTIIMMPFLFKLCTWGPFNWTEVFPVPFLGKSMWYVNAIDLRERPRTESWWLLIERQRSDFVKKISPSVLNVLI